MQAALDLNLLSNNNRICNNSNYNSNSNNNSSLFNTSKWWHQCHRSSSKYIKLRWWQSNNRNNNTKPQCSWNSNNNSLNSKNNRKRRKIKLMLQPQTQLHLKRQIRHQVIRHSRTCTRRFNTNSSNKNTQIKCHNWAKWIHLIKWTLCFTNNKWFITCNTGSLPITTKATDHLDKRDVLRIKINQKIVKMNNRVRTRLLNNQLKMKLNWPHN